MNRDEATTSREPQQSPLPTPPDGTPEESSFGMKDLTEAERQTIRDILRRAKLRHSQKTSRARRHSSSTESGQTHESSDDERSEAPSRQSGADADGEKEGDSSHMEYDNNEVQDDEKGFQPVKSKSTKRRLKKSQDRSPTTMSPKRTKVGRQEYAIPLKNFFQDLPEHQEDNMAETRPPPPKKDKKPPPLVVYYTKNYLELNAAIKAEIAGELRAIYKGDHIRYHFDTMDDYRQAAKFLDHHKLGYYTHQPPEERKLKVVLKGIPESVPTQNIVEALSDKGYDVHDIHQYKQRDEATSELIPLPVRVIELPKVKKSDEIYRERYILDTRLRVENYEHRDGPCQCKNCQRLGHTAKYCRLPPRCVKCAGNHTSKECPLRPTDKPKCALCGTEGHPANFKGCTVYQKALKPFRPPARRQNPSDPRTSSTTTQKAPSLTAKDFPPLRPPTQRAVSTTNPWTRPATPTTDTGNPGSLGDAFKEIVSFVKDLFRPDTIIKLKETAANIRRAEDPMSKILALAEGLMSLFD